MAFYHCQMRRHMIIGIWNKQKLQKGSVGNIQIHLKHCTMTNVVLLITQMYLLLFKAGVYVTDVIEVYAEEKTLSSRQ